MPFLGEFYALAAAMTWAVALVLFKRSGETVGPLSLSLFKNVVASTALAATLALVAVFPAGIVEGPVGVVVEQRLSDLSWWDVIVLLCSGVLGIAIADTLLFYSLNLIGVGLVTVAECSYSPCVMVLAWVMLGEKLAVHHAVGGAMVLSGLFLSSTHAPPPGRSQGQILWGSACAVMAIALMAVGIVWAKPVIQRAPLLPVTMVRLIGGTVVLGVILALHRRRNGHYEVFRPARSWRTMAPASLLGTYLAMIFWVGGFKYADAAVAAVLNQTSTIFALIMAALILKEPFTRRKLLAAILAFAGVVVVIRPW